MNDDDDDFFMNKCLNVLTPEERDEFAQILDNESRDIGDHDPLEVLAIIPHDEMTLEEFEAVLHKWAVEGEGEPDDPEAAYAEAENIVRTARLVSKKDDNNT